jgi:hypothetical protein
MIPGRAARPTSTPVRDVDRELVRERARQLHQVLRSLSTSMDQHQAGTPTHLPVPDAGAVSGRHAPARVGRCHDDILHSLSLKVLWSMRDPTHTGQRTPQAGPR